MGFYFLVVITLAEAPEDGLGYNSYEWQGGQYQKASIETVGADVHYRFLLWSSIFE